MYMVDSTVLPIQQTDTEVEVSLIRTAQALEEIKGLYQHGDKGNMNLRSYYLKPYHTAIIDVLVRETGKGKAEIIRDLIDEWVELQVKAPEVTAQ